MMDMSSDRGEKAPASSGARQGPPPPREEGPGAEGAPPTIGLLHSLPPCPSPERGEGALRPAPRPDPGVAGFERTAVWIFDLDNTLYPADTRLFAQVDQKMGEFIARYLGVPFAYARHLQKSYYRQFGTTLTGLMKVHKVDPKSFLDYVHDLDLSGLAEHPELAAAIGRLPGRKLIFTNGSRAHAERVAGKLGLLPLFEDIFDIVAAGYVPKPVPACYDQFLKAHGVEAASAAMFEDMPHNLEAPHALGMATVLVRSDANDDHPVHRTMRSWVGPPPHVHHMTFDLPAFLQSIAVTSATEEA
jgi:putative hydrolase of the HAD superfamily